jgi:cation transport ATPase
MQNAIVLDSLALTCRHCGSDLDASAQKRFGEFCCAGCRAVFTLLLNEGLGQFYQFDSSTKLPKPREASQFEYLDDPSFQNLYARQNKMKFFVPGLDCTACVWLLDQIPMHTDKITSVKTDFANSSVEITLRDGTKFSEAAHALENFGISPTPLRESSESRDLAKKEARKSLARIAVAAACAGNIMLLSISVYAGVEGQLKTIFQWLMFLLAIPVMTYSALPFYRNSFQALKLNSIHIDLPICLAIWAGIAISFYHLIDGGSEIYFDSLSMLVFLLLGSRHILKSLQSRQAGRLPLSNYVYSAQARRDNKEITSALSLRPGDQVIVESGEQIPADARVTLGQAWINTASLTGESQPQRVGPGDFVFAGTTITSGSFRASVVNCVSDSRVAKLLEAIDCKESVELARRRLGPTLSNICSGPFFCGHCLFWPQRTCRNWSLPRTDHHDRHLSLCFCHGHSLDSEFGG